MNVCFIFRKYADTPSIERVYATIGRELISRGIDVTVSKLPYGNGFLGILLNLLFYRPPQADILHITGHIHYIAFRLPRDRTLLTIHDAGILRVRRGLRRVFIKKLFFDWPLQRSGLITAASQATRLELIEKTGCDPDKTIVIGHPVIGDTKSRKAFKSRRPTILQIGTAPHKNLTRLIEAINGLPCRLVVVGKLPLTSQVTLKDNDIDFKNVEAVTDEEMNEIYCETDILAFCSTFEGFGLPIVEAQAAGIPVVTSNIPPMSDVAGDGAELVDPFDAQSIRVGLRCVIENIGRRERNVEAGIENARRFAPAKIADMYIKLYEKLLSGESFSKAKH
jgi:glycosyltransferase involved in cell wall biosynthesis